MEQLQRELILQNLNVSPGLVINFLGCHMTDLELTTRNSGYCPILF